jgi:hypothetical protein
MKILRLFLLLAVVASAQEALTNEAVAKMVKAGLGEGLIISMIQNQPGKYSLSSDDMVKLKQQGVSDKVLAAMLGKGSAGAPAAPAPLPTPAAPAPAAPAAADLRSVHRIYIDKLENNLDQYLRAEFFKQMKGRVSLVLEEKDADAILTGISDEEKGTGAKVTGRYLGLHDVATGSLTMLDRERKQILWSDEAGDRSLVFSAAHRGGERKVAERLVSKLKKAMGY